MQYFNQCLTHLTEKYKFICLKKDHYCERKLCSYCLFDHFKNDTKQKYILINKFIEKLNVIITELFLELEVKQLTEKFVQINNYSKLNLLIIKEKLTQQKIECFSTIELEILVQIFSAVDQFQSACPTQLLTNQNYSLIDDMKKLNIQIVKNDEKFVIQRYEQLKYIRARSPQKIQTYKIELIGEKQLDILHGQFYYKINNNQVINAGEYQFNKKVGQWMDIENHVYQQGQYQDGRRVGLWKFIVDRAVIAECLYNQDGQKHGQWVDIYTNNMKQYDIIQYVGEYENGMRIGQWTIKFKQSDEYDYEIIGGGDYDKNGNKVGKWQDINQQYFSRSSQIVWEGHYQDGIRVGDWKIKFRQYSSDPFAQIGGGKFDENGQKVGYWLDINESFFNIYSHIIWEGLYQQGFRVEEWKIKYYQDSYNKQCIQIGGGKYNQVAIKIGYWQDINESSFCGEQLIVWEGYYQDGIRVGQWKIKISENNYDLNFIQIGGGKFDQNGNKIDFWIDINESYFNIQSPYTWEGYYKEGFRVGEWKIKFPKYQLCQFTKIGGGKYNKNGKKVGFWVDVIEFQFYMQSFKVIQEGQYNGGFRIGVWKTKFCENLQYKKQFTQIGGGKYDLNGHKIDYWVEINESYFSRYSLIIWEGSYQEGIRVGEWKIICLDLESNALIQTNNNSSKISGGGKYDQDGNKDGYWIDIKEYYPDSDMMQFKQIVIWKGLYLKGVRVGEWETLHLNQSSWQLNKGCGGKFDQKGNKIGYWVKLKIYHRFILNLYQFEGQYLEGLRVGEWKIKYFSSVQIGGGKFDSNGNKVGLWKDISIELSNLNEELNFEGNYLVGVRVGEWKTIYYQEVQFKQQFVYIFGGVYDQNGKKIGFWKEINKIQQNNRMQFMLEGVYQKGIRVGEWKIQYFGNSLNQKFIYMLGGKYDQNGNKIGKWEELDEFGSNISYGEKKLFIWEGNYQESLKVGKWQIKHHDFQSEQVFTQMGGGEYELNGKKSGNWIEINFSRSFGDHLQIMEGNYQDSLRVGGWKIKQIIPSYPVAIGGGMYDQCGKRVGKWEEPNYDHRFEIEYNKSQIN